MPYAGVILAPEVLLLPDERPPSPDHSPPLPRKPLTFPAMPISGPSSYLPTVDAFLSHWESANTAVGSGGVVLEDGTTRAALLTLRDDLEEARDTVTDASVDLSLARSGLFQKLTALQARAVEFNARVRGDLSATVFPGALPEAFSVGQSEAIVREGLRKMSRLWDKINQLGSSSPPGVTQPYLLSGGYALAVLDAERDALRGAYRALSDGEVDLALARGSRNKVQDAIYPRLKAYRQKIGGMGVAYPELVESLPLLTPADGHTPATVDADVVWNATAVMAKVTWSPSGDAALARYEVRGSAGDDYNTDDETVLASVPPDAPRELLTAFALGAPGLTAGFKVYVVLDTGNERGSEAVFVTRPGP